MNAMSNADFAKRLLLLARPVERYKPTATYDSDGVYYSQETREVIGSLIKGMSRFRDTVLEKLPGFRIVIQDGRVRLEHLFLAGLWVKTTEPTAMETLTYQKLIAMAEDADAHAELCPA